MKYPDCCKNIIDVTKAPYFADNTGKKDCTEALRRVFDDVLIRHITATEEFAKELYKLSDGLKKETFVGFECGRVEDGKMIITMPWLEPLTRIIYFPDGVYKVSDTVTYTLKDLKNKYYRCPDYDLSRNIHVMGESRENTRIVLEDDSAGFEKGSYKPLLSFNNSQKPRDEEITNTCQMNMLEDITLDLGNNGGVGVRYLSSNCGRISNVDVVAQKGDTGIYTLFGSQASVKDVRVSGFDYGFDIAYSAVVTMDKIDVSANFIAGALTKESTVSVSNFYSGDIEGFKFENGYGKYAFNGNVAHGGANGNLIFSFPDSLVEMPENPHKFTADNYACVDDFGAVGDGVTDCTEAICRALKSGKEIVVFNEGRYLVNGTAAVPASVKYIDFNFCELWSGERLISGEADCAFDISEPSEDMLFVENIYTQEQFYGKMRLFKQSAVRDVALYDMQTTMASLYFNTVGGSRVYLDNIFLTTGTYCDNRILRRGELEPIYSAVIPLEFHGQSVFGRCVNLERANVALYNDNSLVRILGLRTEGPGTALKAVNGGSTVIRLFNAGIGDKKGVRPLFDVADSSFYICGARASGFDEASEYNVIVRHTAKGEAAELLWDNVDDTSPFRKHSKTVGMWCTPDTIIGGGR